MTAVDARLEALDRDYRHAVFRYALRLTRGDSGWAEDVVQETFLRAWRHRARMISECGSVGGWLMRVAHNVVMDGYRTARMRHSHVLLEEIADIPMAEPAAQILSAHLMREALRQLPEAHRQALEVTYLDDQTVVQAARRLDIPTGTVKSRVFYGLRMLRALICADAPATHRSLTDSDADHPRGQ